MCASLAAESMGHNVTESIMVKNNCTEREVVKSKTNWQSHALDFL